MLDKNKTMKSRNTSKTPRIVITILLIALLGFVGFRVYGHYHKKANTTTTVNPGPTAEQTKQAAAADTQAKKDLIENSNTATNPTTTPPATTDSAITLTAKEETNGTVTVTAKLPGVSSGTCTLSVTTGMRSTTHTADVIYQPEFSSCAGFSVPVSEVGAGTWTITLTLSGGSTATKTTSLEVN